MESKKIANENTSADENILKILNISEEMIEKIVSKWVKKFASYFNDNKKSEAFFQFVKHTFFQSINLIFKELGLKIVDQVIIKNINIDYIDYNFIRTLFLVETQSYKPPFTKISTEKLFSTELNFRGPLVYHIYSLYVIIYSAKECINRYKSITEMQSYVLNKWGDMILATENNRKYEHNNKYLDLYTFSNVFQFRELINYIKHNHNIPQQYIEAIILDLTCINHNNVGLYNLIISYELLAKTLLPITFLNHFEGNYYKFLSVIKEKKDNIVSLKENFEKINTLSQNQLEIIEILKIIILGLGDGSIKKKITNYDFDNFDDYDSLLLLINNNIVNTIKDIIFSVAQEQCKLLTDQEYESAQKNQSNLEQEKKEDKQQDKQQEHHEETKDNNNKQNASYFNDDDTEEDDSEKESYEKSYEREELDLSESEIYSEVGKGMMIDKKTEEYEDEEENNFHEEEFDPMAKVTLTISISEEFNLDEQQYYGGLSMFFNSGDKMPHEVNVGDIFNDPFHVQGGIFA